MENLETYDSAKGISSEHLPIPHGGAKLFIVSIVSSLTSVFLELVTGVPAVVCVVISMTAWTLVWPVLFGQKFVPWMLAYLDRNVYGRKVEFQMAAHFYENIVDAVVSYRVHMFKDRGMGYQDSSVVVPLGGWIRRPYLSQYYHPGWKIRKWDKASNWGLLRVQIQDPVGDALTLPITEAWKLLNFQTSCERNLGGIVCWLRRETVELRDRWNNAIKCCGTRYDIIVNAIHQIHESSRFGHSKEGRRIKEWMVDDVVKTLNLPDRRREELQQQYKAKEATVS